MGKTAAQKKKEKEAVEELRRLMIERYEAAQKRKREAAALKQKERRHRLSGVPGTFIMHTSSGYVKWNSRPSRAGTLKTVSKSTTQNAGASTSDDGVVPEIREPGNVAQPVRLRVLLDDLSSLQEQVSGARSSRSWPEREGNRISGWEEIRPQIFESVVKEESRSSLSREQCLGCSSVPAAIRCEDGCGALCLECDASKHRFLATHLRHTWAVGHKRILRACQTVVLQNDGSFCLANDDRAIPVNLGKKCKYCGSEVERVIDFPCKFVGTRGREDVFLPATKCKPCEKIDSVTWKDLIGSNYFAGSSSIRKGCYIFSVEMLNAFYHLKMASPGLALNGYISSLQRLTKNPDEPVKSISPTAFKDAFEEWRRCTSGAESKEIDGELFTSWVSDAPLT